MRKVVLALSVVIALILLGGVIWAASISRSGALRWDDPDWERAYIEIVSDEPITGTFTFSGTVRLVDGDGNVLDYQAVEAPGCEPLEEPDSGQCGSAYTWVWETDNYTHGLTITEQVKLSWVAPDYGGGIELVIPWVPSGCDLGGAACTIIFYQGTTWQVVIPQTCRNALAAACGTTQNTDGWWFVSSFEGTKPWTRCLPGLMVGGPQ